MKRQNAAGLSQTPLIAKLSFLLPLLVMPGLTEAQGDEALNLNIYYHIAERSGRIALPDEILVATVTLSNHTSEAQTYLGDVADDTEHLVSSGAWALFVDQERMGKVTSTRQLAGPETAGDAELYTLEVDERQKWTFRLPVTALADQPGNYRLRAQLGSLGESGNLIRVAESLATPDWISLDYRPDKRSYSFGEPIDVHFTMHNSGEEDFPFAHGADYRGANRHLRFAFRAESLGGKPARDPYPSQACFGGLGSLDAKLEPGTSHETDLPLLAYLAFPKPGIYSVTAYQSLGFGDAVTGLEEAGWHGDYAYGGTFEIEITTPDPRHATEHLRAVLDTPDEHERRRRFSFLNHPVYLQPLAALVDDETAPTHHVVEAIGEISGALATRTLLALASHRRQDVRIAALQELLDRRPIPTDPGIRKTPIRFHSSQSRRREIAALWDELGHAELWKVFETALASGSTQEAALAGSGILARGDADDVELLVNAADRLAPRLPLGKEQRLAIGRLASTAFSFAWFFGATPVAVDESSSPGRQAFWIRMLRPAEAQLGPAEEALILRMFHSEETLLRHSAARWLPDGFSRSSEIPWRALLAEDEHSVWWYAVQTAKSYPSPGLGLIVRELLEKTSEPMKRRDLGELLAVAEGRH